MYTNKKLKKKITLHKNDVNINMEIIIKSNMIHVKYAHVHTQSPG